MEDYTRDLCVRGFHVYRNIWEAAEGEVLECEGNANDRYAVLKKGAMVNGHLPKKLFCICSVFLRRGETFNVLLLVGDNIPSIYLKEALRFHVE